MAAGFVDHCSAEYENWKARNDPNSLFTINLSMGVMKPMMQSFVGRGLDAIKTPAMKECIKACFKKAGLLDLAREEETVARALQKYPQEDEDGEEVVVVVPEGVEVEENLGAVVEDAEEAAVNNNTANNEEVLPALQFFDVEVFGEAEEELISEDDSDEESVVEEPEPLPEPVVTKRGRNTKPNSMVGGVKKGKYSRN